MGLDTSHGCWHGPYSRFRRFRRALAKAAWGTNLDDYEGFQDEPNENARSFADHASDPLVQLIDHSDCDGELAIDVLLPLAARLDELAPKLKHLADSDFMERAMQFADGLREAASRGEPVEFH
jgi:hypothetical protein